MLKNYHRVVGLGLLISLLLFMFLWSCGDGPIKYAVEGQESPPETVIASKTLSKVALETDSLGAVINLNQFAFTIEYYGTDQDGTVDSFMVRMATDSWPTAWTTKRAYSGLVDFTSENDEHKVEVKSKDNEGNVDPTPAVATLSLAEIKANKAPTTSIVAGPANGGITSGGVTLQLSGSDENGNVIKFMCSLDGGSEITVDADEEGKASVVYSLSGGNVLSEGNHVFAAYAVDNLGAVDDTPDSRSFFVKTGFVPILQQSFGPADGGGWFAGAAATFRWSGEASFYSGVVSGYSFALDDTTRNGDGSYAYSGSSWLDYSGQASADIDIPEGTHVVYMILQDAAGGVASQANTLSVALPTFDQGILVVNGVSWSSYSGGDAGIDFAYEEKAYWGNHTIGAFWDLFDGGYVPTTLPAYIGTGPIPPDVLAKYSSVVWVGNNYQGDLAGWSGTPILAYLKAGGNVLLGTRNGSNFFDSNLTSYAGVSWREGGPGQDGSVTLREYVPVFPGLVSMEPFTRSISSSHVFSGGGFLNSSDDNTVTNWDGSSSYTKSNGIHTLLFAHRSSGFLSNSPFSYVRGLGSWAHPNLIYSSSSETTFPTQGTAEAQGNFVFIAGRNYGLDRTNSAANYDFILTNLFGEQ